MIDRIAVRNFKSLREVDVSLGRMNLLIGANASGKSNLLEVFQVFQGIGRGLTIPEVLDGVVDDANATGWKGIRGGSGKLCSVGDPDPVQQVTIQANGRLAAPISHQWEFKITFKPTDGRVVRESLQVASETVYSIHDAAAPYMAQVAQGPRLLDGTDLGGHLQPRSCDSIERAPDLGRIHGPPEESFQAQVYHQSAFQPHSDSDLVKLVARSLANAQRLDPLPNLLRERCAAREAVRMGDQGRNFLALLRTICQDEKTKDQYFSWIREFSSPSDDVMDVLSLLCDPSSDASAVNSCMALSALSDGTLRFAALVAAFFQRDMPELVLIDEVETSIHAGQARILVELLRTQSECAPTQVIATSHSPVVLEWLRHTGLENVYFCNRDYDTGNSVVRPLLQVPRTKGAIEDRDFFDILSQRWLELIS